MWSLSEPRRRTQRNEGPARAARQRRGPVGDDHGLGSILDQLVARRPLRGGMALGVLARRWQDVVGERLARECSPAALDAGVLFVRASSQAWAAQIRFLSGQVRERAEEVVGEGRVAAVRVVVGPV